MPRVHGVEVEKCSKLTPHTGCCIERNLELCIALPNCKYKQKERRKREILSIIACCLITGVIVTPVIILLNITGLIKNSTVVFNTGFFIGLFLSDLTTAINKKFMKGWNK